MARIKDIFYLDENGLQVPDLETVYNFYVQEYKNIYGDDVVLTSDTQDGQWIAIQAQAAQDLIDVCSLIYNSFSPSTALADGLDRNVRINGIRRKGATFSQCDVKIVGTRGTRLIDASVKDVLNRVWDLPKEVIIPVEGEITVTATASEAGAWTATPHTLTIINTPMRGWKSVDNENEAFIGAPKESDAALRRRQSLSVALPSQSVLGAIVGSISLIEGVTRLKAYENDTSEPDANGIPSHSTCMVVEGGDAVEIAAAIFTHKTVGSGTFGDTEIFLKDRYDLRVPIRFQRPTYSRIKVRVTIIPLEGYVYDFAQAIRERVVKYINSLGIGDTIYLTRLIAIVLGRGSLGSDTFDIVKVELAADEAPYASANIPLLFDGAALTSLDLVSVVQENA